MNYRQQIIFKNKLTIINDSKSTSFSSSIGLLKSNYKIYWLLGGIYKKKINLIYQKNISIILKLLYMVEIKNFLIKNLKGKINYNEF